MIYAIQAVGTNYVKFGITAGETVNARIGALQVGCPFELAVLATADWSDSDEQRIHRHLRLHSVRGEWFVLSEQAEFVIACMLNMSNGRQTFIDAFLARSNHGRLSAALDYCRAEAHQLIEAGAGGS